VKVNTHLHLVPRSKKEWSYTPRLQYAFMAWCSVKAQEQLHLYLYSPYLEAFSIRNLRTRHAVLKRYPSNSLFSAIEIPRRL
jgi:hypothetical protein